MLVSISATHQSVPFETLESLSAQTRGIGPTIADAHESIRGVVVVSTCNRFEAYLDVMDADGASPLPALQAAIDQVADLSGVPAATIRQSAQLDHGAAVARHLFSVASGLESVALGEDEIAGQVKRSIEVSRAEGTATSDLEQLFQRASEASREVRAAAPLSLAGRSLVGLALDLAASRVTDWNSARVLLVGSGRYAGACLAALRARGAHDIHLHSISGRGHKFAHSHDVPIVSADDYAAAVASADVVIACTTADGFVLDADTITRGRLALEAAPVASQLLIDLGMPRNVDPQVMTAGGLEVLDLETIRLHAPIDELAHLDEARRVVASAADRFATKSRGQDVSPAVVAVRTFVSGVVDDEIARLAGAGSMTPETERALRHLGGVLMHRLTTRGHDLAGAGEGSRWLDGLETVLGIPPAVLPARVDGNDGDGVAAGD
ncbi:glutamyl-tRNA reductase [soil metagenome]